MRIAKLVNVAVFHDKYSLFGMCSCTKATMPPTQTTHTIIPARLSDKKCLGLVLPSVMSAASMPATAGHNIVSISVLLNSCETVKM